jgi:hypothetical protein
MIGRGFVSHPGMRVAVSPMVMRATPDTAIGNDVREGRADRARFPAPCRSSRALLRGWVMRVSHGGRQDFPGRVARATLAAAFGVALLTATPARGDMTASYDGTLFLPKQGEDAIVAGGLMQAGVALSGTVAVNSATEGVTGVYYVTGTLKGVRFKLTGSSDTGALLGWKGKVAGETTFTGKAKLKGSVRAKGTLSLAKRVDQTPVDPPDTCSNEFFAGQVMGGVLNICAACHVQGGAAEHTTFRVVTGDPLATQASVALHVNVADPDRSRILEKPLAILPHAGGQRLAAGSAEEQILRQWVTLVATGNQCQAPTDATMVPMRPNELLVRASMDLRGKRPALAELDAIEADAGWYATFVDQYLQSPEFLDRVKDLYDDALLVRREDDSDESRDETAAIYGEALALIAYIVQNDRPFTEIGTADYTVANDLFQRDLTRMPYAMEPVAGPAWQPTRYTDGRPHAGLLSTSAFYEVWDTNNTNVNRRRANRWSIVFHCYNFLDTPVDVTRDVDNNNAGAVLSAVTTRADCKACHDRLDPLASFLFPTDNANGLEEGDGTTPDDDFFSGNPERWRTANKRPPAVYGMPGTDLRDMGRLLVENEKFAQCQTQRAFQMLFLRKPKTNRELTLASEIAARWQAEDAYNFRALVRRWMLSDAYIERPENEDPDWVRRTSPERLEAMLRDATGFLWTRNPQNDQDDMDPESDPPRTEPVPLLTTEENAFKIILGGINGVSVTGRSTSLNASIVTVQRKVASLAAAFVVTNDLALPDGQRKLLNGATNDDDPAVDEAAVRATLSGIARRLYGERWAPDAPEIDVWFALYRNLYRDTTQAGAGGNQVPGTQGERAWRGTLVAMLRSPRILIY